MSTGRLFTGAVVAAMLLAGCSQGGSTDVSPAQDKQLRNNFARELSADEVQKLTGGKTDPASSGQGGPAASPPKRTKG